jgi:hypothetical protein
LLVSRLRQQTARTRRSRTDPPLALNLLHRHRGANLAGQLGLAAGELPPSVTAISQPRPVAVVAGADGAPLGWGTIHAGDAHTCGIAADASAWCWGENTEGELGTGDLVSSAVPVRLTEGDPGRQWLHITVGRLGTCGIQEGGLPVCFGDTAGEVGPLEPAVRITTSTAGSQRPHSCAISANGTAFCWGNDRFGQLGDGVFQPMYIKNPLRVAGNMTWGPAGVVRSAAFVFSAARVLAKWPLSTPPPFPPFPPC